MTDPFPRAVATSDVAETLLDRPAVAVSPLVVFPGLMILGGVVLYCLAAKLLPGPGRAAGGRIPGIVYPGQDAATGTRADERQR